MERSFPLRRCIGCQNSLLKRDLLRVVKPKDEGVSLDPAGKRAGRGAYICSLDCFLNAAKRKRLSIALKSEISKDELISLTRSVEEFFGQNQD